MQYIVVEAEKWWLLCNFFVNRYVENFDYVEIVDFWYFSNPAKSGQNLAGAGAGAGAGFEKWPDLAGAGAGIRYSPNLYVSFTIV